MNLMEIQTEGAERREGGKNRTKRKEAKGQGKKIQIETEDKRLDIWCPTGRDFAILCIPPPRL